MIVCEKKCVLGWVCLWEEGAASTCGRAASGSKQCCACLTLRWIFCSFLMVSSMIATRACGCSAQCGEFKQPPGIGRPAAWHCAHCLTVLAAVSAARCTPPSTDPATTAAARRSPSQGTRRAAWWRPGGGASRQGRLAGEGVRLLALQDEPPRRRCARAAACCSWRSGAGTAGCYDASAIW